MIRTESLCVRYGSKLAVSNVSLEVPQGELMAIVGPSGCGKSSFLAALNRMTDLIPGATTTGRVMVDCCDVYDKGRSSVELRKCVGMIFQTPNPFPMSIRRNIQLALREHGLRDKQRCDQIMEEALMDVGLWDEVKDRLGDSALELSGGQQQRLCIARALALKPQVLLMDEPCSALDPISSATVEALIQRLKGRYTIAVVTHNLAQAMRIADHIAVFWLRDGVGQVIEQGPTKSVFGNAGDPTAQSYLAGKEG